MSVFSFLRNARPWSALRTASGVFAYVVLAALPYQAYATQANAATSSPEALLQPNTMAARVAACTFCHGEQGRAAPDGYYPRLAGKPLEYLYHQLLSFRDGQRQYQPMQHLLHNLPDSYLHDISAYFSQQSVPYPAPERPSAPAAILEQGRSLVMGGDPARKLPACIACHGATLSGAEPGIPGLLGLPNDYLVSQLGAWQHGLRHAAAPDCMADIANALNPTDIRAVSAWLAAQAVTEPYLPEPAGTLELPLECGSQASTRNTVAVADPATTTDTPQLVAQGQYLATISNCMGCHTASDGQPYAGGTALQTSFGTFYGPNITPDLKTGIGSWNKDDFWQALHHGKSKDGSLLYPAFPYTEYTRITRSDADELFTYLQTLPPVQQANQAHQLKFPYNMRPLLAAWRGLYFSPGVQDAVPGQTEQWTRGRYLVNGPGHCAACHTARNSLGAANTDDDLSGGLMAVQNWYAQALTNDPVNGLGLWSEQDIAALLKTGVAAHSTASGPMAEVVINSTQYLSDADALAIGVYLKSLPGTSKTNTTTPTLASPESLEPGKKLYTQYCAQCHQDNGQGSGTAWPTLVANPTVTAPSATNAIHIVLDGGYAPTTAGNPQPHGMPPFSQVLNDNEIALLLSYIRNSWGNKASLVDRIQVSKVRAGQQ